MAVRVGINGFGRIGRSFYRAILARGEQANVELVAVNDPFGDANTMAFLLKHDSVGGTLPNEVKDSDARLLGRRPRGQEARGDGPGRDPVGRQRRRHRHRVDRSVHRAREGGRRTSTGGAKRVIISAPSGDADAMICMGVNDEVYDAGAAHRHLERVVHDQLPRADGEGAARRVRHRAGPHHHGARVHERPAAAGPGRRRPARASPTCAACAPPRCRSSRAPPARHGDRVVLPDAQGQARRHVVARADADRLDHRPRRACSTASADVDDDQRRVRARPPTTRRYRGVLEYSDEPLVSADIVGNPASCIFSALDTMANGQHGEGARLVRQRVGLLQPPRRPRRVHRRAVARSVAAPIIAAPRRPAAGTRRNACWCAPTSTCRCATASIDDDLRITTALPTIEWLLERGARVVVCGHLGRPKGTPDPKYSMAPVAARLAELLGAEVPLAPDGRRTGCRSRRRRAGRRPDGAAREPALRAGGDQERPRVRARAGRAGATSTSNEAFGASHRAHASIVGPPRDRSRRPAAGCCTARSRCSSRLLDAPTHPFVAVLGGAKVSDKLGVIDALLAAVRHDPRRRGDGVHVPRRPGPRRRRLARRARHGRRVPPAARHRAGSGSRPTS